MSINVEVNAEIDEGDVESIVVASMRDQLDEFIAIDNPCGIGQSFQKAVTKACNGMVTEAVQQDTMSSAEIQMFVREELRNALLNIMRGWDTHGQGNG
tara:strand:- start:673 stop:966 length:294 start_codon:yes stop_codon:yes gene_type:complete